MKKKNSFVANRHQSYFNLQLIKEFTEVFIKPLQNKRNEKGNMIGTSDKSLFVSDMKTWNQMDSS